MTSIEKRKPGLGTLSLFESIKKDQHLVCEVKQTAETLHESAGIEDARETSRTALLGLSAAREALQDAGLTNEDLVSCGFVSANSVGGMDKSEQFYPAFLQNRNRGKLKQVIGHTCAFSSDFIADQLGIRTLVSTISTACSSSANAIMFASRLIKHKRLERVIAGGCDALTRFTLNGFSALNILDRTGSKPFDENRSGLNLGEGAGFLVLESEQSVLDRKREALCEITGFANTCDAFHQTASSPEGEGSFQAMQQALAMAELEPSAIDYINAHGTGTRNNDLSEGKAIERLFSSGLPFISSTKPFTGHTLGAAGGIEAVFACLSIRERVVFPNINWQTPMKELNLRPNPKLQKDQNIRHVLSNSFGFGGNDTSLIFSRC